MFEQQGLVPKVCGTLEVGAEPLKLRRAASEKVLDESAAGRPKSQSNASLLERLAQDAIIGNASGASAASMRRRWIRGTRFLFGDDISLLVDSQNDYVEQRRQLYADLFGVGHIEEIVRNLRRFIKEVRPRANELAKRVESSKAELLAMAGSPSDADGAVAEEALQRATVLLGLPDGGQPLPFDERLARTDAALTGRRAKIDERRKALVTVEAAWPEWPAWEAQGERLRIAEEHARRWHERMLRLHSWITDRLVRYRNEAEALAADCGTTSADLKHLSDTLAALGAHPLLAASRAEIEERLPAVLWNDIDIEQQRTGLASIVRDCPTQLRLHKELGAVEKQMSEVKPTVPTSEAFSAAEAAASTAAAVAKRMQQNFDAAAGPLHQMQSAAQTLLEALGPDEQLCPLCAHDWEQPSALRTAIRKALDGAPEAIRQLDQSLQASLAEAKSAATLFDDMKTARVRAEELAAKHLELLSALEPAASLAEGLGLPKDERLWETAAAEALARLNAAEQFASLFAVLDRISAADAPDAESGPAGRWTEAARFILQRRLAESRQSTKRLNDRIAQAERIATRRNDLVQNAYGNRHHAAAARANWLVSNRTVIDAWALLSGEALSQEALTAVQRSLEREEETATEAARLVAQARSAQNASRAALQRHKLEADVKDLDRRHAALRGPVDNATATLDALETYEATYVGKQLNRLMPLVQPLFFRLHANRVFDNLRTGGIADPLRWKADADGHAFDPSLHFSQGQRQDLALALFLARACELKGTFFLDEPLVHLDDLNRVAALDVLRAIALTRPDVQLVFTTANRQLALHLREKFARRPHLLHVIELEGNPRQAVRHSDQALS